MPAPAISGIYTITNTLNGKQYIGSAVNFEGRWRLHRRLLRKTTHHSAHLQSAWNVYGEAAFVFAVVEEVPDLTQLIAREQHYLDQRFAARASHEYNMSPTAGSTRGYHFMYKNPRPKWTPERRAAQIERMRLHPTPGEIAGRAKRRGKPVNERQLAALKKGREDRPETIRQQQGDALRKRWQEAKEQGTHWFASEKWKRVGEKHKGKTISPAQRQQISAKLTGHVQSPEQIAKRRATFKATGFAERQSVQRRGIKQTPETLAKRKQTMKDRGLIPFRKKSWSDAEAAEVAQAHRASVVRAAKARRGIKQPPERRAKTSAVMTAWWQARKAAKTPKDGAPTQLPLFPSSD